ncbi:hypothetical protein KFZ58_18275 [Virgibacillus sp. NKC19-16]|uniref:LysR substrate-binding domain-containing protein n=1 Tax=Virgibacillus salidurans TaxID=2831673 RepID=UPI001F2AC949|nr:LysR substrate-binding domain-containing protein [Virgibacillus sp. NKC19-16]UJL46273.1 hypothetical protein KFZ58_18275 [Virgibacillus sp. NKC19-16]
MTIKQKGGNSNQRDWQTLSMIDSCWSDDYEISITVGMMVDSMETCKEMVIMGLGYAILPTSMLEGNKGIYRVDLFDKNTKIVSKFVDFIKTWN